MEVDLNKLLKATYRLRNKFWRIQYEGLHTLYFKCGRYGHTKDICVDDVNDVQNENSAKHQA